MTPPNHPANMLNALIVTAAVLLILGVLTLLARRFGAPQTKRGMWPQSVPVTCPAPRTGRGDEHATL